MSMRYLFYPSVRPEVSGLEGEKQEWFMGGRLDRAGLALILCGLRGERGRGPALQCARSEESPSSIGQGAG